MKNIKIILAVGAILFIAALLYSGLSKKERANQTESRVDSKIQINDEGGVSVEVELIGFDPKEPVRFQITFNTHQGDLNFDLTKISFLVDDNGKEYPPLEWQGGSGGHHLSGVLVFPVLSGNQKMIKLIMRDIYGINKREFKWDLK